MRKKILIVDDEEMNRELLRQVFESEYEILMAENGKEAIRYANHYRDELAVILLDLVMPVVDGYQVLQVLHAERTLEKIPVILITADTDEDTALKSYTLGVTDMFYKPFVAQIVRQRVFNAIEMYQSRERLEELLERSNRKLNEREHQLEEFYDHLVEAISNMVEFRDVESGTHVKRVKGLTQIMAESYRKLYPEEGLTQEQMKTIVQASALHDIGKIAIPDSILLKPGRLTDEEREIMQQHTTKGCDILAMLEDVQDTEHYKAAYEIARYHHERYDGRGYPDGLVGDEIPLSAQLVSVVDVYDALVCKRVYKKAFSKDEAYHMIINGECGVFNPKILKCFEDAREMLELLSDSLAEKE
ncbi:MAG: response regulator [Muribaculaceae bacterium]|nr:response regulator [Roseburia sp.]MCM1431860.1 response regulator [Muribaculaceae bacterium]MCM1493420.1 response regulator [Muribaculaceae bacterium]